MPAKMDAEIIETLLNAISAELDALRDCPLAEASAYMDRLEEVIDDALVGLLDALAEEDG